VAPLRVPALNHPLSATQACGYDAVRLFAERARSVVPQFELTDDNASTVARICQELDGLPLAIELAAVHVRLFPPSALLSRLHARLALLTSGARDLPTRHQSLRAALDWSYDILEPAEQVLFRRLAVFRNGCTLEAMEAVCAGRVDSATHGAVEHASASDLPVEAIAGLAESLLSKSLLRREEAGGEVRLRFYRTIREYAAEKLVASGERARLWQRHATYYARHAAQAEQALNGPSQVTWLDRLERERDNVRLVFRRALPNVPTVSQAVTGISSDPEEMPGSRYDAQSPEDGRRLLTNALRLGAALSRFWYIRGYVGEGRTALAQLLAAAPATLPGRLRARALNAAGQLAWAQGDLAEARQLHRQAQGVARRAADQRAAGDALLGLGNVARLQGAVSRARHYYERSLEIRRRLGDARGIGSCLYNLGHAASDAGDDITADRQYQESLAVWRSLEDHYGVASAQMVLGLGAYRQGALDTARSLLEQSLDAWREMGNQQRVAHVLRSLGLVALQQGDHLTAQRLQKEGLKLRRELGDLQGVGESLWSLAMVARALGDVHQSLSLLRESLAIFGQSENRRMVAVCFISLAGVAVDRGQPAGAARLLGAARALIDTNRVRLWPTDREDYDRNLTLVWQAIGEDAARANLDSGAAMDLQEAVAFATSPLEG
jgi:tetratricopeptide (TPR) repeat protein